MNLKNPLIILLSLFCACQLVGYGKWEPNRANMFVINKTGRTISVWMKDAKVSAKTAAEKNKLFQPITGISGWELAPGKSGWLHSDWTAPLIPGIQLFGPLFWSDETGIYMVKHFAPWWTFDNRVEVELRKDNDRGKKYKHLPGFYMRRPWKKGVWPATKIKKEDLVHIYLP